MKRYILLLLITATALTAQETNDLQRIIFGKDVISWTPSDFNCDWFTVKSNTDCGKFHPEQTTIEAEGYKPVVVGSNGNYTIKFVKE